MVRDRLMKEIATFQEGVGIRAHEVEEAKISAAKDEAELSRLKNEEKILKEIVEKLKERKEQIEKAVEKERIQKEQEEKQKKEAEESESKEHKDEDKVDVPEQEPAENTDDDKAGILDNPPPGQNLKEDPAEPAVEVVHNAYASLDIGEENAAQEEEGSKVAHASDPSTGLGSKGEDATKDIDSLSREELGREIGSRWSGKNHEQQHNDFDDVKNNDETSVNAHDEENDGYDTETDEYHHQHYEEDDTEDQMGDVGDEANDDSSSSYKYEPDDEVDMSGVQWLFVISPWVCCAYTILLCTSCGVFHLLMMDFPIYMFKILKAQAAHHGLRRFNELCGIFCRLSTRSKLQWIHLKLKMYEKNMMRPAGSYLKQDQGYLGPEKEFYSLYGQCFESKQNKYVYKVCPFKEATQEEGYSRTLLGQWEKFEESYSVMLFSNGDKCWNGPDRSLKVKLQCGLKVQVADELEDELRALNKEQPQLRDEL
ncbi:hypothetical protein Ccrd_007075 [Cynara cardunculus var. scolymus]|uniref:MRH domain-containing protein n=1 Tax=Cynara cardunculus var. scolymus TaxID=59895 RepID=A0A103XHR2_CYNCS|nr:hypothetical protein Ccrd_007075 [Cynara cardunculus var. scolymus]